MCIPACAHCDYRWDGAHLPRQDGDAVDIRRCARGRGRGKPCEGWTLLRFTRSGGRTSVRRAALHARRLREVTAAQIRAALLSVGYPAVEVDTLAADLMDSIRVPEAA